MLLEFLQVKLDVREALGLTKSSTDVTKITKWFPIKKGDGGQRGSLRVQLIWDEKHGEFTVFLIAAKNLPRMDGFLVRIHTYTRTYLWYNGQTRYIYITYIYISLLSGILFFVFIYFFVRDKRTPLWISPSQIRKRQLSSQQVTYIVVCRLVLKYLQPAAWL